MPSLPTRKLAHMLDVDRLAALCSAISSAASLEDGRNSLDAKVAGEMVDADAFAA